MARSSEQAILKALKKDHLETLRRKDALHSAELEKKRRLEWRAHQQQLEELANFKKALNAKDKELAQLTERLLFKQDECDKLEGEVKRLRSAESWKTTSPNSSTSDLSTSHVITVRERDMAMRNSELSFRIRTLEDNISISREQKQSLEKRLASVSGELSPIKDQNSKLKVQCNELNATVRSRERKLNQISQEILDVKSSHQQLQEEFIKQQKNVKQLTSQCSDYRTQKEKLKFKNEKLRDAYNKLSLRVKELEETSVQDQDAPNIHDDDSLSVSSSNSQLQEQIDQLEFDRDELDAKYAELKNEYRDIRSKYKALHNHYQKLQMDNSASLLQLQKETDMDKLALEREVVLLRCMRDENFFDGLRQNYVLDSLKEKWKKSLHRIECLEKFIIEQDEFMSRKEAKHKEEMCKLNDALLSIQVEVNGQPEIYEFQYGNQECKFHGVIRNDPLVSSDKNFDLLSVAAHAHKYMDKETSCLNGSSKKTSHEGVQANACQMHVAVQYDEASQLEIVNVDPGKVGGSADLQFQLLEGPEHRCSLLEDLEMKIKDNEKVQAEQEENYLIALQTKHTMSYSEDVSAKTNVAVQCEIQLNEVDGDSTEVAELQLQLSKAQEHGCTLQLLLEELEMKLKNQEKVQAEQEENYLIALQTKHVRSSYFDNVGTSKANVAVQCEIVGNQLNEVDGQSTEVAELRLQLSEAQEHGYSLQVLLENFQMKLKDQENVQAEQEENYLIGLQTKHTRSSCFENVSGSKANVAVQCEIVGNQLNEVDDCSTEVAELRLQLSQAQEHGCSLELLLEEFQMKLKDQEKIQAKQQEKYIFALQTKHTVDARTDVAVQCECSQLEEVDGDSSEIAELKYQLSEARKHGCNLQLLLEELEMKLNKQERLQAEQQEKYVSQLQAKERKFNDILRTKKIDEGTVGELAKEISNSLLQVEEAHLSSESRNLLSNLQVLRECTEKLLKMVLKEEYVLSKVDLNYAPSQLLPHGSNFDPPPELHRIFLVVMDYDPQSLCITGQPDLELSVQSGALVTVYGEMDEKGYYMASRDGTLGMLPANFIQEVNVHDETLISRLMNESSTSSTRILKQDEFESMYNDAVLNKNMQHESGSDASRVSFEAELDSSIYAKDRNISVHHQSEDYRMFLGLYDYEPLMSSASATPEFELSFKEGSLIKVFGQKMSDGYYIGEINGQRGLVPADFIADTSQGMNFAPLHIKTKMVVALYDYKPLKDSPNSNNESELQFQAGDHIVIYGNMHSDGFYTGQEKGQFGLVPSNYVKDLD